MSAAKKTKAKAAPGPWVVGGRAVGISEDHVAIHAGNAFSCALFGGSQESCMANARLIAAAPDLLAACEHVFKLCDGTGDEEGELQMVADRLRPVIAKARGES